MSNNASSINVMNQEPETGITFFNNTANPIYIPDELAVNAFQFLSFQELLALRGTNKQLSKLINTTIAHEITANIDARILPSLTDAQKIDLLHVKKLKFENCNLETLKEYFESSGSLTDHNSYLCQVTAQDNTTDPTAKQEVAFEDIELIRIRAEIYTPWEQFHTQFRESFTDQNKKQRNYKFNLAIKEYNITALNWYEQFLDDINSNNPTTDEILRHTSKLTLDFPITLEQAKMVINKLKQINPDCELTIFNLIQQDDIINDDYSIDESSIDRDLREHIKADFPTKPQVILGLNYDYDNLSIPHASAVLTNLNNTNYKFKINLYGFYTNTLFNTNYLATQLNSGNFPNLEYTLKPCIAARNLTGTLPYITASTADNLATMLNNDLTPFKQIMYLQFSIDNSISDLNTLRYYYRLLNQKTNYPYVKIGQLNTAPIEINNVNNFAIAANQQTDYAKYITGITRKDRRVEITQLDNINFSDKQLSEILGKASKVESLIIDASNPTLTPEKLQILFETLKKRQENGLITQKIIIQNLNAFTHKYKKFVTEIISTPQNQTIIEFQNSNLSVPNLLYLAKTCWLTTKKVKFNSKCNRTIFNLVRFLPYMIDGIALSLPTSMLFGGLVISTASLFFAFCSGLDTIIISAANLFKGQKTNPIKYFYNNFSTAVREFFRIHSNQSLLKEMGKITCIISLACFAITTIVFIISYSYQITLPESMENDRDFKLLYAQEPQMVRIRLVNTVVDMRNLSVCNNIYKAYKACGNFTRKILGERQAEQVQPTREA
ncbi:hypothetical protein [Rickettsiales endosymbiont of Stachyamoeba lipophora]|uniref:hypothetical protein n=1 Tax=Rickettsiales endosymbiont of Stachyamoeba lipophora TaxID=2486578 RepID=UPI000F651FFB|nr:hypothetical protein [Rickettsiales endosymbiont of Stachyamoeba lipophora]AZL16420.1 hypothetical protein EF513_07805 [Rickettsiales endosymbiont of Stachyamoeba lipophora]